MKHLIILFVLSIIASSALASQDPIDAYYVSVDNGYVHGRSLKMGDEVQIRADVTVCVSNPLVCSAPIALEGGLSDNPDQLTQLTIDAQSAHPSSQIAASFNTSTVVDALRTLSDQMPPLLAGESTSDYLSRISTLPEVRTFLLKGAIIRVQLFSANQTLSSVEFGVFADLMGYSKSFEFRQREVVRGINLESDPTFYKAIVNLWGYGTPPGDDQIASSGDGPAQHCAILKINGAGPSSSYRVVDDRFKYRGGRFLSRAAAVSYLNSTASTCNQSR